MNSLKPNILIVEDEKPIADTIVYALSRENFNVLWTSSGADAISLIPKNDISMVILDIGLPDINGFDICRKIRAFSTIPILFLTARSEEIDRIIGLEIGGDDYMVKPFSPRELVARVRAILRRFIAAVPAPTESNLNISHSEFTIDDSTKTISYFGTMLPLTKQEFRILQELIQHPGRVFSREQLLEKAWDESGFCSERTIDTHIKTIRTKLTAINNQKDPIVTHRGFGYSLQV